jgi:hypothetical protein
LVAWRASAPKVWSTHAPHHATPEWTKKISDMHLFDKGWNALRDQIFENQKKSA